MSVDEVIAKILLDKPFYGTDGGVTFSGGEPLCQDVFMKELLMACRRNDVSTAIETNLAYDWYRLEPLLPLLDLLMFDLKIMDTEKHRCYTGMSNEAIIENLKRLNKTNIALISRTPLIAGINDDDTNIDATVAQLKRLRNLKYYEILPYHSLGESKADALGMSGKTFKLPTKEKIERIIERIHREDIPVVYRNHEQASAENRTLATAEA